MRSIVCIARIESATDDHFDLFQYLAYPIPNCTLLNVTHSSVGMSDQ